jgi:hypothetical protein
LDRGYANSYALVDLLPHGHHHQHKPEIHGYMGALKLAGGFRLVLSFGLALQAFFRRGSFGAWLHEGGVSGTRKQVALAAGFCQPRSSSSSSTWSAWPLIRAPHSGGRRPASGASCSSP